MDDPIDAGGQEAQAAPQEQETPAADHGAPQPGGTLLSDTPTAGQDQQETTPDPAKSAQQQEDYKLTVEDGLFSTQQQAEAAKNFKDIGLPKETAQKIMDMAAANQKRAFEEHRAQVARWGDEVRMDKEMGGPNFDATVANAKVALNTFDAGGEVFAMLDSTGYANNPSVMRFLASIGKKLGDEGFVNGKGKAQETPLEERLYGKINK